jgi:hypothetical protein
MLKRLAILIVLGAFLCGWLCVAQNQQPQSYANQNASHDENRAKQENIPQRELGKTDPDGKKPCQSETEEQESGSKSIPQPWYKLPAWISIDVAAVSTVIAFFTLVFFAVQVWLMRITAHRQLRAYVVAETGIVVNVADPIQSIGPKSETEARITHPEWGPVLRIQIKNTGQTPAYDVIHWAGFYFREWPLESALPPIPAAEDRYRSTMGPGVPITKTLFFGPRLTDEQIKGLRDGTAALYCQGEILYRDAFKKKHFTRYRLMYHLFGGAIGVNTDLTFAEEGNETDDTAKKWWQRKRINHPLKSN